MAYSIKDFLRDLALAYFAVMVILLVYAGLGSYFGKVVAVEYIIYMVLGFFIISMALFMTSIIVEGDYADLLAFALTIITLFVGLGLLTAFLPLIRAGDIVIKIVFTIIPLTIISSAIIGFIQYIKRTRIRILGR